MILREIQTSGLASLVLLANGQENIYLSGSPLHSERNPIQEGTRFADKILALLDKDEGLHLLVIGLGLGYFLFQDRLQAVKDRFIIFEPYEDVYSLLIQSDRISRISGSGYSITGNLHQAREWVQKKANHRIESLFLPSYNRRKDLPSLDLLFGTKKNTSVSVDETTTSHFARQWMRNALRRIRERSDFQYPRPPITLEVRSPVIYCGAGPRLLADLSPLLQSRTEKPFLISSDTAVGPLFAAGLEPDLVLSTDSGRGTMYHLENAKKLMGRKLASIPALTWLPGSPLLEHFFSRVHFYRSTHPLDQILGLGPLKDLPEWRNDARNQAGLALLLTAMWGGKTLLMAGASFTSVSGRSHTEGTGYRKFAIEQHTRTRPAEAYQPGGYLEQTTRKNALALRGLEEMAKNLSVELMSPSHPNFIKTMTENGGERIKPVWESVNSPAPFLEQVWNQIDWTETGWNPGNSRRDSWKRKLIQNF